MDTLEKDELTASICHISRFLKSGIPIMAFPKSRIRLTEKRDEREEKQKQLQSLLRFT